MAGPLQCPTIAPRNPFGGRTTAGPPGPILLFHSVFMWVAVVYIVGAMHYMVDFWGRGLPAAAGVPAYIYQWA